MPGILDYVTSHATRKITASFQEQTTRSMHCHNMNLLFRLVLDFARLEILKITAW